MTSSYHQIDRQNFGQTFLSQGIRRDGRNFESVRLTVVNINSLRHTEGSSTVSLGDTKVVCGIKAELAKPKPENPSKGFLVLNVDLPALCSPLNQPGPPNDESQTASTLLNQIFEKALNLESLCVAHGRLAWVLYVDIVCLNLDGGLLEAATFGVTSALKNAKLPSVKIDQETGAISVNTKERNKLKLNYSPFGVSFAVFDQCILQDPTIEEEGMATEIITVFTSNDSEWTCIYNPGSRPMSAEDLTKCMTIGKNRAKKLDKLLKVAQEKIAGF